MKIYSDTAVTKSDLVAIDAKQDTQLASLKFFVGLVAVGTVINFAILVGYIFASTVH